jgi:hypothetical protein
MPPEPAAARPSGLPRLGWGVKIGWAVFFVLLAAGLVLAVLDRGTVPVLLDSISQ